LEKTRFADKFDYEIDVDESLNTQSLKVPGMLVQPFLKTQYGMVYVTEQPKDF
jgi:LytS/YehU family sensor histidine kinase